MKCMHCNAENDQDAQFCTQCGGRVRGTGVTIERNSRKAYLYALLLLPVLAFALAVGYYKYILPKGIVAVVNGEEINRSELDAAFARSRTPGGQDDPSVRFQVLQALINGRLMAQAGGRAGIAITDAELGDEVSDLQTQSGLSEQDFRRQAASRFGSIAAFEQDVRRSMLIRRFIAEKIAPANADPVSVQAAVSRRIQELAAAAAIRVTLSEEWSGAQCACNSKTSAEAARANRPCDMMQSGSCRMNTRAGGREAQRASEAALQYWREKHGPEPVTTKVTDFGCHMQVDIVKNGAVIGSLRYQAGSIGE